MPPTSSVVDGMAQQRDYSPVREAAREQSSRRLVILGAVLLLIVLGALGWYSTRERAAAGATAIRTGADTGQCARPCARRCADHCACDGDG